MNIKYDPTEASTQRGFVRLVVFSLGAYMILAGYDSTTIADLLLLAKGVDGLAGVFISDKPSTS